MEAAALAPKSLILIAAQGMYVVTLSADNSCLLPASARRSVLVGENFIFLPFAEPVIIGLDHVAGSARTNWCLTDVTKISTLYTFERNL